MATNDQVPPRPGDQQLVDVGKLNLVKLGTQLNLSAFTGSVAPAQLWQMMTRGDALAIPLYRELEDKDDDVASALDELKYSVLEREWSVEPGDDSQAALDARDFAVAQLNGLDFDGSMDSLLDAAAYGFSVQELMFDTSMGQASLQSIDDCPQELFLFGPRLYAQVGPLQLLDSPFSSDGKEVPEEKFAVFSYRGRGRSRMGRPLLKSAFWPSWFKRQALGLWLIAGQKSNGTAIARYANGATQLEQQNAMEAAQGIVDGVAMAIPEGMILDLELLKAAQDRRPDLYEKLFERNQYAIHRAIKGETLTSFGNEGGRGSNAQGETHADTFDQRSVSLAKKAGKVVNQQVLGPLHLWNFGPQVPAPVFSWDVSEEKDLNDLLGKLQGAQKLGISIPGKWAAAELQIPPCTDDDPALTPNSNLQLPALPGAAFAEDSNDTREITRNMRQLDLLCGQMQREAKAQFRARIREVAEPLVRGAQGR